jgi:phage terminase large subunit GpA-like protein
MSMPDGAFLYRQAFHAGLMPDPDFTVSEWADEHRMLSQKASAEPGRWRTDRTPYLKDIMDELSPHSPIETVVFMAGAQVGKSETGNNWTGFIIDHAPGPMMLVQPTTDTAKRFSKQRLAPMFEETPRLKERIADPRSRDSGNTQLVKEFLGGVLVITGANSAVGLRSMPVRYLFLDEVDGFPVDVDGEGDPVILAIRRTTTFARRKIFMCSTPTVKDVSRIEREFNNSDQRRYFVPCPHCGHMQWLRWAQIKWTDDDPKTAAYVCEDCGTLIDEHHKTDMLTKGEWRPTAEGNGRTAGFHLSSLYSPLGWKSWSAIVEEFIAAKNDAPLLKGWVNTVLGETWEEEFSAKIGAEGLQTRAEFYDPKVLPARVLAVTAGVDVQDNRLAVSLYGWGRDEECWTVAHQEIYGDPARPEVWAQLDDLLLAPVDHELAEPLAICAACIDSGGHHTHDVYAYARDRRTWGHGNDRPIVMAIKGQSQRNKPAISKPARVDLNWKGRILKSSAEVWPVGVDTIKSVIYARLKHNEPGPGYVHFHSELPLEFYEQLTAEKQITKYVKGFPVREWTKKSGARNEALDTAVYAYAALQSLYLRYNRRTIWDQFERALKVKLENSQELPQVKPKPIIPKKRPSFVTNW